jgi:hypothetical protein
MRRSHGFATTAFTQNDQKASPLILQIIQQGDLIIRDLFFWGAVCDRSHSIKGVYFLSRLKYGIVIYEAKGKTPLDLLATLQKHGR